MSRYFEISGYWKDSKEPFESLLVKETDDIDDNDGLIFEYGWSESDLKEALNETEGVLDFVITEYKEVE